MKSTPIDVQMYYQAADDKYIFSNSVSLGSIPFADIYSEARKKINSLCQRYKCEVIYAKAMWFDEENKSFCEITIPCVKNSFCME